MEGRPIGRMVADTLGTPGTAPPGNCDDCGCRLSTYRAQVGGAYETTCAPCQRRQQAEAELTLPMFQPDTNADQLALEAATLHPTPPPGGRYDTCECGASKQRSSARCRTCSLAARSAPKRHCKTCGAELAKGVNKTGLCGRCIRMLTTRASHERRGCAYCGRPVDYSTARAARRSGKPARCQGCYDKQRAKAA